MKHNPEPMRTAVMKSVAPPSSRLPDAENSDAASSGDESESTSIHNPDPKMETLYPCLMCSAEFSSSSALVRHAAKHDHVTGKVRCHVCLKEFSTHTNMKLHLSVHASEKPYKCRECPQTFFQFSHLRIHERKHTGEKPYKCPSCDKCFAQSAHLACHVKVHSKEQRRFTCDMCPSSFDQKRLFDRHLTVHATGRTPYECKLCGRMFKMQNHLGVHMTRSHPAAQSGALNLTAHSETESEESEVEESDCDNSDKSGPASPVVDQKDKERPYQCNLCPKTFRMLNHLGLHKRKTHGIFKRSACDRSSMSEADNADGSATAEEMLVKCELCPKAFRTKAGLQGHKTAVHVIMPTTEPGGERPFRCDICLKRFKEMGHLNLHRRLTHELGPLSLPKRASSREERPFECRLCQKTFATLKDLRIHWTRSGHSDHEGGGESTGQGSSSVVLLEERPFQCNICQRKFKVPSGLTLHRMRAHNKEEEYDDTSSSNSTDEPDPTPDDVEIPPPDDAEMYFLCPVCNKGFKQERHLKIHRTMSKRCISDSEGEDCPASHSTAGRSRRKRKHRLSSKEKEERPYECNICERRFKQQNHLSCHKKMSHLSPHGDKDPLPPTSPHDGSGRVGKGEDPNPALSPTLGSPLSCDACGSVFSSLNDLEAHSCTHREQQSFTCELCSKEYSYRRTLVTHIKVCHPEKAPYKCEWCSRAFNMQCSLRKHELSVHIGSSHSGEFGDISPVKAEATPPRTDANHQSLHHLLLGTYKRVYHSPPPKTSAQSLENKTAVKVKEEYTKSPPRFKTFVLQSDTLRAVNELSSESDISEPDDSDGQRPLAQHLGSSHLPHCPGAGDKLPLRVQESSTLEVEEAEAIPVVSAGDNEPGDRKTPVAVTWELFDGRLTPQKKCNVNTTHSPDRPEPDTRDLTSSGTAEAVVTLYSDSDASDESSDVDVLMDSLSSSLSPQSSSYSPTISPSVVKTKSGKKMYRCEWCGRCFAHKSYLPEHYRIHQQVPHNCPLCAKVFHTPSYLRRHMRTVHKDFLY